MKSRIANRYLLTAVMALMLCAVLAVSSFAAIGLKEDGTLSGLQSAETYTANSYDIIANTTGSENIAISATTQLDAGIWAVSNGTTTEYVFVPGTESGKINFWNATANAPVAEATLLGDNDTLVAGKWSKWGVVIPDGYLTVESTGFKLGLRKNYVNDGNSLPSTAISYGFTAAQAIPANTFTKWEIPSLDLDLLAGVYTAGKSAADLSMNIDLVLKVPGATTTTTATVTVTGHESGKVTVNAPASLATSNAYIIGVKVAPWANSPADIYTATARNTYAYLNLNAGVNALAFTPKYSVDVAVTNVTLNKDTLNLMVGDTAALTATVTPDNATDKAIVWSTTDGNVATVDNGAIVATGAGTATITATAGGKSATCTVTVTAEPILPNHEGLSVTLAGTVDGLEDGKTYTIQSYDVINNVKGTKSALTASTVVDSGAWYVSNGEKGGYIFVTGDKTGEITYWDAVNNKPFNIANSTSTAPVAGKWTRSADGAFTVITYYAKGDGTDQSVCLHFNKDKFLKKADGATNYAGSTPISGADNKLQESVIYYGFTSEQVVPASMVNDFTAASMTTKTGACSYNTGKSSADHKGTFTFYVYNPVTGETTTYDIDTVGEQKVFAAPAAMTADTEGYLIGFAFAPFAKSADDLLVCASTDLNSTNGYAHVGMKSSTNKLNLKDSALPAPTGIEVVDNKVTGLKAGSYYQYAPVVLEKDTTLVIGTPVVLDANAKPEGLFVVRETNAAATSYTAWTEDMFYIAGSSINNILHTKQVTGTGGSNAGRLIDVPVIKDLGGPSETATASVVFTPGVWSGFNISSELQKHYSFDALRIGGTSCYWGATLKACNDATDPAIKAQYQETIKKLSNGLYFSYGLEPDEIIEMKNWASYKFTVALRQGSISVASGAIKTKVTLYVVNNGVVETREALYNSAWGGATITTKQEDFADNSGYIVGIEINPFYADENTTLNGTGNVSADYNLQLIADSYKVVLPKQPAPTGLYLENGVVKGLDAKNTYAWAYQYIDSQSATTKISGVTELSGITGLISVMTAGDNSTVADSDPILFYVPGSADGRATIGTIDGGKPAFKTSSDWIAGTWTGSYLSWHDQDTGAYCFLDQTAGVTAGDAQKLWLYQNTKEQAQARLDADAAKSAAEGVPASWTTNKITSNPARLQAVIDAHYAAADYNDTLAANKLAHQQQIANGLESRYIQYAYDETEIIPVDELVEMSFTSKSRQTDYTFTATPKAVFYVMDSNANVTEYSAMGLAETYTVGAWKRTTVDVQSIENWPEEGWVVAVRFYPLGEVDAESIVFSKTDMRVDASNIAYSFTQHHVATGYFYEPFTKYVILSEAEAPIFEVTANAAGEGFDVTIANYSVANVYEYKAAADTAWTTLPAEVDTFTVPEVGTYTVRVSGDLLIGTAQADCVVELLTPTAPTLDYAINSANDFKVTIKNASKLYNYEYKAAADADWTAVEGNSFVVPAAGTYEVRATGEVWNGYANATIEVALVAPVAPKVSVIPGEAADFTINIKNYSDLYSYEYKLDTDADWTAVPAGEKSFIIYAGGQYTIRAGGVVYDGYATANFKAVEVPQEIKALTIEDGVLKGLDASIAYEYANVNYLGISDTWTAIPAGTEYTFAAPGLYAVRLAATGTEEASTAMVFNKLGTIADRGTIINLETKSYGNGTNWDKNLRQLDALKLTKYTDKKNPQFTVGYWTGWNVGDLAYWSQDWITAIGSTNYIAHSSLGAKITAGTMSQEEVRELVSTYVFKYAYEDAEIIPFADLEKFKVRTGPRQGHILVDSGKVYSKFVVYIANDYGEIETRELVLEANYSGVANKTTHTIKASDFEETSGYIVAIDVYPFGEIPETTTFKVSGTVGQDYEAKFLEYQVKLPRTAAPTTLSFNEETQLVEGLDPDIEYYYAPYTVTGVGETKYVAGQTTLQLTTGLWGIGIVSTDPEFADSLPYIVFVRGDEDARKDLGEYAPNGYFVTKGGTDFIQGTWTGPAIGVHSTFGTNGLSTLGGHVTGTYANALRAAEASGDAAAILAAQQAAADVADTVLFRYAFTNEEVIPANELLNFKFTLSKRMGSINLGAGVTAKVTFYVITENGDVETYVWEEATSTTTQTKHDIDVQTLLNGVNGYVAAIDIKPWTKVVPENVVTLDGNGYNTMAQFNLTGYVIKLQPAAPEIFTFDAPKGGKGEMANLNENMTYEYKVWDEAAGEFTGDWIKLPENITSYRIEAGKYLVRVAESRNFTVSDSVEVTVAQSDVERISLQHETKKIWLPNDFIEVAADYEIDITKKVWIARLALDNMKAVSPEANVTIKGENFKYVVVAEYLNTDKAVHYYNFALAFDGESRHDTSYNEILDLAGDAYITEFFTESVDELPFEQADLYIKVGSRYDGQEVELRTYNERIGKLRKTESATVENGWAMFTNYGGAYVILSTEE